MSANEAPIDGSAGSRLDDKKLDSRKEIAVHLGREIRTVQRWEKTEGLPVRRHEHQKRSTVYAYASELDEWFKKRQPADDPEADAAFEPEPDVTEVSTDSGNSHPVPSLREKFVSSSFPSRISATTPDRTTSAPV